MPPRAIEKDRLLLVEGNDEDNFFAAMLSFMVPGNRPVQILTMDGKDKFSNLLQITKQEKFKTVKKLGVVMDADNDPKAAFDSVKDQLKNFNLTCANNPEEFTKDALCIGVYIMPGGGRNGALETICLEALTKHPRMACIDAFVDCVQKVDAVEEKILEKMRLQCFISTIDGVRLPGEAARNGCLDLENATYDPIKKFLTEILN